MDLQAPGRDVCLELGRNGLQWVGIGRFGLDRRKMWTGARETSRGVAI